MKLILLRHAKSDWSIPGTDDRDRPLNARGKADAREVGDWLQVPRPSPRPDPVLRRAAHPRDPRAGSTCPRRPRQFRSDLYLADADTILAAARRRGCGLRPPRRPQSRHRGGRRARLRRRRPPHPEFAHYPTGYLHRGRRRRPARPLPRLRVPGASGGTGETGAALHPPSTGSAGLDLLHRQQRGHVEHPHLRDQRLVERVVGPRVRHPDLQDIVDLPRQPVRLLHLGPREKRGQETAPATPPRARTCGSGRRSTPPARAPPGRRSRSTAPITPADAHLADPVPDRRLRRPDLRAISSSDWPASACSRAEDLPVQIVQRTRPFVDLPSSWNIRSAKRGLERAHTFLLRRPPAHYTETMFYDRRVPRSVRHEPLPRLPRPRRPPRPRRRRRRRGGREAAPPAQDDGARITVRGRGRRPPRSSAWAAEGRLTL